jgi:hypothetical protein
VTTGCPQGELETKTKFWGKSIEVMLTGVEGLQFRTWGEEYRWVRAGGPPHDTPCSERQGDASQRCRRFLYWLVQSSLLVRHVSKHFVP